MTAGTKYADTRSASRWMGARLRWASPTMRTIWASRVSAPTRSARMTRVPVPLRVAAGHAVAVSLLDGNRLAADHRLVDGAAAVDHHAVDGDLLTGAHAQTVADRTWLERDVALRRRRP